VAQGAALPGMVACRFGEERNRLGGAPTTAQINTRMKKTAPPGSRHRRQREINIAPGGKLERRPVRIGKVVLRVER
jgi:hypothetical protein